MPGSSAAYLHSQPSEAEAGRFKAKVIDLRKAFWEDSQGLTEKPHLEKQSSKQSKNLIPFLLTMREYFKVVSSQTGALPHEEYEGTKNATSQQILLCICYKLNAQGLGIG